MNRQDQITSLIWLLIGLFIIIKSIFSLEISSIRHPGPGLFPMGTGIILSSLSLISLIRATIDKSVGRKNVSELWAGLKWHKMFYTLGATLVFIIVLDTVGFLLSTFFLLTFLLKAIEPQGWKVTIGLAVLISAGSYILFDRILQLPLPKGFLGF